MDDIAGVLSKVQPGDEILLDNSDYIAVQSYYRHQVPADLSFHAWDQFRDEDGKPTIPQRSRILGTNMTGTGTVQDGEIQGNVIVVQALNDESTCPWCADWYRHTVIEAKGNEDHFRLYYHDHSMHANTAKNQNTFVVNYMGVMRQALLDLSDWIEKGIEPLPSTNYIAVGGDIIVEGSASRRRGMQPTGLLLAEAECIADLLNAAVCGDQGDLRVFDACLTDKVIQAYAGLLVKIQK